MQNVILDRSIIIEDEQFHERHFWIQFIVFKTNYTDIE